jgi:hypothetical protein
MDPEPRAINPTQCNEDSSLQEASRSEHMCQVVVFLLSRRIRMVDPSHHSGSYFDQSDHKAKHVGPQPTGFLPRQDRESCSFVEDKGYVWRCQERHARLQGSLYIEWRSAPCLSVDRRQASSQEPTDPSDHICSRPHREVSGGPTYELGQVLGEPARTGLQGSA